MLYYQTNPSQTGVNRIAEITSEDNAVGDGESVDTRDKSMKKKGRNRTMIAVIGLKQSPCRGLRDLENRETLVVGSE